MTEKEKEEKFKEAVKMLPHFTLANSVGVIDSDYRGEICFIYREIGYDDGTYFKGDRIGQLVIIPLPCGGDGRGGGTQRNRKRRWRLREYREIKR